MTHLHAVVAAVLAAGLVVAGVVMLAGLAWGLITAGVVLAAVTVLLYDPAQEAGKRRMARKTR